MTHTPRTVITDRGLSSADFTDPPLDEFCSPSSIDLPLPPDQASQSTPNPRVKVLEHRACLTEAKVSSPAVKIAGEFFHHLLNALSTIPIRKYPDLLLEALQSLGSYFPPIGLLSASGEGKS